MNRLKSEKFKEILFELKESGENFVRQEIVKKEEQYERYLVIILGRERFGILVKQIQEIVENRPVVPVPDAPLSVLGIINYRNRLLPVTNMHNLLQAESKAEDKILLLITRNTKYETALSVDGLVNLIRVKESDIKAKISGQKPGIDRMITGEVCHKGRLVALLDMAVDF